VVKKQLAAAGWRTAIVWECATRGRLARESLGCVIDRLAAWIRDQDEPSTLEIAGTDLLMSSPPAGNNST
jgi:G:T-mismatch repair DNA endonuclease (very short patch repair protein)